ncbi:MAG: wax ester/triacylglycerol synthase family O-acyltransferase [Acidimicrobiales bacterium]
MRQLSGIDTSFLAWEGPTTVGHVTSVLVLDPTTSPQPWTFERFAVHLASRLDRLTPLTEKLLEVPLGLDRPYWVADDRFDLDYHLRHLAVPEDGGRQAFADLVARIHERPLDRRRPLWECYVVDGVVGGTRRAVITKIHHAAIDGLSGQEILAQLVDLDPHTPVAAARPEIRVSDPEHVDERRILARAARSMLVSPARLAAVGVDLARALPVIGPGLGRSSPVARGDETPGELVRRLGAAPPTPFNATIGPHRRWAYASVPLAHVKAIKNAAGTTVNDAILAMVAGVVRAWLLEHDALPDRPLAAMVPLSVRRPAGGPPGGNMISPTITTLATHLDDPAQRLAAIKASMDEAKKAHDALPADLLTDLTQVAPPAVAALAARLVASTHVADRVTLPFNLVVSNVPGPPIPLYLAGAEIVGHYPVSAIVDGVGLNVTVLSTNGTLDVGFVADRDLVPDLWSMADGVTAAVTELAAAVGADLDD